MKKIFIYLLLAPLIATAQFKPVGNSLGLTPDHDNLRVTLGPVYTGLPYLYLYQRSQVDSGLNTRLINNQTVTVTATGDATGVSTANGRTPSLPLTLATVNSNVGTFGDASHTLQITFNGKGLGTAVVNNAIQIAQSQVTGLPSALTTLSSNLSTTNSTVSTIYTTYADRSASQTFTGVPTFNNGINTNATSNYNYPSTGNYYTAGGNQFALSGGGLAWQGGASIQNAGSGTPIIYNNGAAGHTFQLGAANYLQIYSTGSGPAVGHILSSVEMSNSVSISALHFTGYGSAPTVTAGVGAGTSPTISCTNCTDFDGTINITTGTSPATGIVVTVTFNTLYASSPNIVINPGNQATALLGTNGLFQVPATTLFTLNTISAALTGSTVYKYVYHVAQ